MNKLVITNIGLAIYAELELNQKPTPLNDGVDGWEFKTNMQIEQMKYGYANSAVQRIYELNLGYFGLRRKTLKQLNKR